MTNVKNQHVVPRQGSWAVKHETGEKASKIFENKADAMEYAKDLAKRNNACMVLHDREAKIQRFQCRDDLNSYSGETIWSVMDKPWMAA